MKTKNLRFELFRRELRAALGDNAVLLANGSVTIPANEFSPVRSFRSVQDAIDNFARHLSEELKGETK